MSAALPLPPRQLLFLNVGHLFDHLVMLLFPVAALALVTQWEMDYASLLALSVPGFVAFSAGGLPAGWLGDRWSRRNMMILFFFGIGGATVLTGFAEGPVQLSIGLGVIGLFASIYHPIATAMVVSGQTKVGKTLAINGVFGNMGVALGPLLAGFLTDQYGWRMTFLAPGAVILATGAYYAVAGRAVSIDRGSAAGSGATDWALFRRLAILIGLITLFGGIVFHVTTVGLPKLFSERLGTDFALTQVGWMAAAVYATAAFAQIPVGLSLDRFSIRPVMLVVLAVQVPLLLALGFAGPSVTVGVALVAMLFVFGEIPIQDAMVARYVADRWRSRVYALKYVISLGASAIAVPMMSGLLDATGSMTAVIYAIAAAAAAALVLAFWLPSESRPTAVRSPSPAE